MSLDDEAEVGALLSTLFEVLDSLDHSGEDREISRPDGGVVVLDDSGHDHTLEVTVEKVPRRRWRPAAPVRVGSIEGLDVAVVGVDVASFVTVHVVALPGAEPDRRTREYDEAFERWALTAKERRGEPPAYPSEVLTRLVISVEDTNGTAYARRSMRHGGTGTEWDASWSFRPRPPVGVRELGLTLQTPGGPVVPVRVTW